MTPTSTPAGGIPLSAAGSTSSASVSTGATIAATAATSTVAPAAAVSAEHAITEPAAAGERAAASASAEAPEPSAPRRRPQSLLAAWPALLALCLAMLVEMVDNSILNIALPTIGMLVMTMGMRTVMTTGAVALLGALPETHTSIGSAMNDTVQELGNALGVSMVGTVMAAVMGTLPPEGAWDASTVSAFVHSQRISFGILAAVVVVLSAVGVRTLTDSRETEEH